MSTNNTTFLFCSHTTATTTYLQQVLRIVTLSSETGKGGFFPQGLSGKINSPAGYNVSANGFGGFPGNQVRAW